MKQYKLIFLLIMIVVLISSSVALGAPGDVQTDEPEQQEATYIYTPEVDDPQIPLSIGATDLVHQGTAWVAEKRYKFNLFRPYAWGTQTKTKAAGDQWVHIAPPLMTRADGAWMYIEVVEFCAKSSNGAQTKPVGVHLRSNLNIFLNESISWPADNAYHCWTHVFNPPIWKESLGVSVLAHYANTTDKLTFFKSWVRVVP